MKNAITGTLHFFHVFKTFAELTATGFVTGLFTEGNDQSVVFVVNGNIRRQCIHKNLLQNVVMQSSVKVQMPFSHPPGVGINDKNRFIESIKQDTVRRFPPDTLDGKQFAP